MKIYNVKINGKKYRVELESVDQVNTAPVTEAAPAKTAEPVAPVADAKPGEGQAVTSPIQGQVVGVKVKVGDKVKKGDVVVVVEAMKLENDVVSTVDGVVSEVLVTKGQNVTAKAPLIMVK